MKPVVAQQLFYSKQKLQTLDFNIAKPNFIAMVLQCNMSFGKGPEIGPLLKLAVGNHFFPVVIPQFGGHHLGAVQPKSEGAVFASYFHIIPFAGGFHRFGRAGDEVV